MPIYGLLDCNNFYASCERVFNPKLENQPIVILSNNDGCIIARSNEAKNLGIPMGAPYFQWHKQCKTHHINVFSSNYELYGDMSQRIMHILQSLCPQLEIYSIDEAFFKLPDTTDTALTDYAAHIKQTIQTWTGIPVSIGMAPTKTLAKLANTYAKKTGVFNLLNVNQQHHFLNQFPVEKIWGIGSKTADKLHQLGIHTAKQLRDTETNYIRTQFNVMVERITQELRGIACLPLEAVQPRKQIMSSRSFGRNVTSLAELNEALSHYTARACVKLRQQKSMANGVCVFLYHHQSGSPSFRQQSSHSIYFPTASCDTHYIISMAKKTLGQLYQSGLRYRKTGILLLDLTSHTVTQSDLFSNALPHANPALMHTLDHINEKLGSNTLFFGAEGTTRTWQLKCDSRSPRYTTHWNELATVT